MNPVLTYFFNVLILAGLIFVLHRRFKDTLNPSVFYISLGLKIVLGFLLGIIFQTYYSGGDTWVYFEQASALASKSWNEFWTQVLEPTEPSEPVRAIYFTRITAVLLYVTKANYWIASVYFSVFSFFGSLYFLCALQKWNGRLVPSAVIAFLFFPTAAFWSSGLLKESLAFGALLWLVGGYLKYENGRSTQWTFFWLSIPLLILGLLKYYILAVLLPLLIYLIIFHELEKRNFLNLGFWQKSFVIFMAMALPAYLFLIWLHPNFELQKFSRIVLLSHEETLTQASAENAISPLYWTVDFLNPIFNFFYYLFSGLFRPLLFEKISTIGWISSFENSIILGLLIWKIFYIQWSKIRPTSHGLAIFIFVFILAFFLSFTIPNLGALARFKVYYVPFFLFMILIDHPVMDKISKMKFLR